MRSKIEMNRRMVGAARLLAVVAAIATVVSGCSNELLQSGDTRCNQRNQFYFSLVEMRSPVDCTQFDYNDNDIASMSDWCDWPDYNYAPETDAECRPGWVEECRYDPSNGAFQVPDEEWWSVQCRDFWQSRGLDWCTQYGSGDFRQIHTPERQESDFRDLCPEEDVDWFDAEVRPGLDW